MHLSDAYKYFITFKNLTLNYFASMALAPELKLDRSVSEKEKRYKI